MKMKSVIFGLVLTLALTLVWAAPARADYFVWRDSDSGLSLAFPDTWKMVSNADENDAVTVMAPAGRGHAACRVRVDDDRRYVIYPSFFDISIQKIDFSTDFWMSYLREYNGAMIYEARDTAGLGRGYAGYAETGFESAVQGPMMSRRALMFASLYSGKLYVLECSAHEDAFAQWKPFFLSIADTIDFKKAHHELATGHYRNFLEDPDLRLMGYGPNYYVIH